MRKACIDLNATMKFASLSAGDLGSGKCLYHVNVSNDLSRTPTADEWKKAMNLCQQKAEEFRYEVSRIRGKSLAEAD